MAPRKKHQCSVVIFDVNAKEDFKQEALTCYLNICGDKYFADNIDCSQLILVNTAKTNNKKNDEDEEKYLNILEATGMVHYDPDFVKHIEDAKPSAGNWLEGLHVGVEELLTASDSSLFDTYQIIVFSDFTTPMTMEKDNINKMVKSITKQLCQIDGYIYFLGPDIPISNMLSSKADVYNWAQTIECNGKNANTEIVCHILEECMGIMCDLNVGLHLVQSYKYGKRGFPFLEPLKFDDLEIHTACLKYLECKPALNPRPIKDGPTETIYVYAEDQSREVDYNDTIRGLALHNKLVVIPDDVSKGVKEYSRFFKLLGFTDASNVPEDYMLATNTNIININESKDFEIGALNYIINACHKFNKYGIALRAYMKNSRPKLYCLIPKLEPTCFIAVELPYAEDVNILYETKDCSTVKFKEDSYADYNNVTALKEDIYTYLDSMDMKGKVKVHPNMRENFCRRKIISNLLRKKKEDEISESQLPLGDLKITPEKDLYTAINENWFAKNETNDDAAENDMDM